MEVIAEENEIANLQREVSSLLPPPAQVTNFYMQVACLSITPDCEAVTVYVINVINNGTTSFPSGYSIFLSFNDTTRLTLVDFNTTLPGSLDIGGEVTLSASSWPSGSNATSKMSPGDQVGVAVGIGNYESAAPGHVITCSTYTTAYSNYTVATYVTSVRTCQ